MDPKLLYKQPNKHTLYTSLWEVILPRVSTSRSARTSCLTSQIHVGLWSLLVGFRCPSTGIKCHVRCLRTCCLAVFPPAVTFFQPCGCPAGIWSGFGCSRPGKGTSADGLDLISGAVVAVSRWAGGLIYMPIHKPLVLWGWIPAQFLWVLWHCGVMSARALGVCSHRQLNRASASCWLQNQLSGHLCVDLQVQVSYSGGQSYFTASDTCWLSTVSKAKPLFYSITQHLNKNMAHFKGSK